MPTPSEAALQLTATGLSVEPSSHLSCPPEYDEFICALTPDNPISAEDGYVDGHATSSPHAPSPRAQRSHGNASTPPPADRSATSPDENLKKMRSDEDMDRGTESPGSTTSQDTGGDGATPLARTPPPTSVPSSSSVSKYEFSRLRLFPNHCSSFLRPGSKFVGTQHSDQQVYNVDVEIKHVDITEASLCGYLRIQGLTETHPTLTTYFEGEMIGNKYTFQTRHEVWGATEGTDMSHWARFPAWRRFSKHAKRGEFPYHDFAQCEDIFMRWKEYFLVPDHRVRTITGASFEGFYYICFNQVEGAVSGIYFHAKSEKFQKLELKHVPDHGCCPAIEFR